MVGSDRKGATRARMKKGNQQATKQPIMMPRVFVVLRSFDAFWEALFVLKDMFLIRPLDGLWSGTCNDVEGGSAKWALFTSDEGSALVREGWSALVSEGWSALVREGWSALLRDGWSVFVSEVHEVLCRGLRLLELSRETFLFFLENACTAKEEEDLRGLWS